MKTQVLESGKFKKAPTVFCFLVIGFLSGYFLFSFFHGHKTDSKELRSGNGKFTNPLLECEIGEGTIASKKIDFSDELQSFVSDTEQKNNVNDISVYVRDLNNGPVIGVDQDVSFAPASLLKVPMLIAYLKWSEDNPKVLEEKFEFKKKVDVGYTQEFAPSVPLEEGNSYTALELLESMTKYSDNQALVLLFERLPRKYQADLYVLLGVDPKLITDPNARLTTKQYSVFFRILFNSSFLSQKNSEYALKLLSESSFKEGLRSVVPAGITVSHKFGERKTKDGLQQFHDCGIVYYPKHPQLICVMTKGGSVDDLIKSIREVSEFVYDKIHTQYKEDF